MDIEWCSIEVESAELRQSNSMVLDSFTHFCLHCLSVVMAGSKHPCMVEIPQTNV